MTPEQIDKHLDAVLRASGSALRNYSLEKSKADMRAAILAIIAQARAELIAEMQPVAWRVGLEVFGSHAEAVANVRNPDLQPLPLAAIPKE